MELRRHEEVSQVRHPQAERVACFTQDQQEEIKVTSAELRAAWITALESGEYKQVQGTLKDPNGNGYCCLGVLCDVYSKLTGRGEWRSDIDESTAVSVLSFHLGDEVDHEFAPKEIENAAGLRSNEYRGLQRALAGANDEGATFAQIVELVKMVDTKPVEAVIFELKEFANKLGQDEFEEEPSW